MNMLNQRVTQLHKLKSRSVALIPREGGGGGGGGGGQKLMKKKIIHNQIRNQTEKILFDFNC